MKKLTAVEQDLNQYLCPCGSKKRFTDCCLLIISGEIKAETAEQLMRSRYSAYATNNAQYIFDTYALKSKQAQSVEEISAWAKSTTWLSLEVVPCEPLSYEQLSVSLLTTDPSLTKSLPTVRFTATYLVDNTLWKMSETSKFVKELDEWRYLDGDITEHNKVREIKRNDLCPCGSRKKFKKCCAK